MRGQTKKAGLWRGAGVVCASLALALSGCVSGSLAPDTFGVMPNPVNGGEGRAFHQAVVLPDTQDVLLVGGQGAGGVALNGPQFAERISCPVCSFVSEIAFDPVDGRVNPVVVSFSSSGASEVLVAGGQVSGVDPAVPAVLPLRLPSDPGFSAVVGIEHYTSSFSINTLDSSLPGAPEARGAALVTVGNGAYLIGGRNAAGGVETGVYRFVANTGFVPVADLNIPREGHTATELADGSILVVGGWDIGRNPLQSAEIYTPGGTVTELTGGQGPVHFRALHTATASLDGCEVLIYGGIGANGSLVPTAEVYRTNVGGCPGVSATFSELIHPSLSSARVYHTATLLNNRDILIVGGLDDTGAPIAAAQIITLSTSAIREASGELVFPRFGHTASLFLDGTVLIAGGLGAALTPLADAERFLPLGGL